MLRNRAAAHILRRKASCWPPQPALRRPEDSTDLHQVRIAAKERSAYTMEICVPAFANSSMGANWPPSGRCQSLWEMSTTATSEGKESGNVHQTGASAQSNTSDTPGRQPPEDPTEFLRDERQPPASRSFADCSSTGTPCAPKGFWDGLEADAAKPDDPRASAFGSESPRIADMSRFTWQRKTDSDEEALLS